MRNVNYFLQLSSGVVFEISELDFNNLSGRQARGQTNGWYSQRGESIGERHQWVVQFKDVASFWASRDPRRDYDIRPLDVEKRLPPKVGKVQEEKKEVEVDPSLCASHDWNNMETCHFETQNIGGMDRYFKVCNNCKAKSVIIKKREVEVALEKEGKTLVDLPVYEG